MNVAQVLVVAVSLVGGACLGLLLAQAEYPHRRLAVAAGVVLAAALCTLAVVAAASSIQ